ncbi:MAG TPA: serine hydrolase [Gallionella sp.]|jgi:CubicO group peptidase (beta-lactamase class C family)|nr:serine hydrolase domain-containing protein [Gallionella sp.]OGS68070.1 MAG: serine hydrolase [Gallionellales bacterium GWA2_54_124]OGT18768.1 MAG: serine hydrolase [Gallionellales bacterium RIFOXYD12_FULL_53_10]OGT25842.1 MAG: serine hydrolase [Gallionellales bacterium RIFOXYD2_FULL_52_7]HCI53535.1 serine hydrolase [Gallionella sp.]
MKFIFLILALFVNSAQAEEIRTVKPEEVGLSSARLGNIGKMIQGEIEQNKMAGAVVLVARHGKIAYFETFGRADTDRPMQRDTMFRICSMTKPVVTLAVLQLYEEGKLLLSDPVAKYIPEFSRPKVIEMLPEGANPPFRLIPAKRDITIKDLLTHTAGMPYPFASEWYPKDRLLNQMHLIYEEAGISSGMYETEGSIGDMVKRLARLPIASQPGDAFIYGMAADVQGYLVEVVSGQKLDDYISTHIFAPLKMNDSYFFVPESKQNRLSAVWKSDWHGQLDKVTPGPHKEGDYVYSPTFQTQGPKTFLSGGVGIVTTPYDYFRFSQMLLNKGELDGVRVVSRKTVELMTRNQIGKLFETTLHDEGWKFGLGLGIQVDREHNVDAGDAGTFEWAGLYSTRFSVNPKEEKITIFLSQTHPFHHHFDLWDKLLVMSSASIAD